MRALFAVLAAMLLLTGLGRGARSGKTAPDFSLPSLDGTTAHLSNFRGHIVLLTFWATWCGPCRVEMPWLVEADRQYRARGLRIVAVNMDDPDTSREVIASFARQRGVTFPVLLGNAAVAAAYGGIHYLPHSLLIGPGGTVLRSVDGITSREEFDAALRAVVTAGGRS